MFFAEFPVTLLLTFVLVTVSLTALFWGLSLFLQPFLYSEPADRLGLRSLAGALVLSLFLTGWTYINTRASHQGKYDTLLEFKPTATREITEFQAVHRQNRKGDDGQWVEELVPFRRGVGRFVETGDASRHFTVTGVRNGIQFMTVALLIPQSDGGDAKRYDANLTPEGASFATRAEEVIFTEKGGSRYVEAGLPGVVYSPSLFTVIVAMMLNGLHYAIWFVVFWPILRYTSGAALGLAFGFGLLTMLMVMPLLFEENRIDSPTIVATASDQSPISIPITEFKPELSRRPVRVTQRKGRSHAEIEFVTDTPADTGTTREVTDAPGFLTGAENRIRVGTVLESPTVQFPG